MRQERGRGLPGGSHPYRVICRGRRAQGAGRKGTMEAQGTRRKGTTATALAPFTLNLVPFTFNLSPLSAIPAIPNDGGVFRL